MKTCSSCGQPKLETDFWKRTRSKDGLYTRCKACGTARDHERRKTPEYAAREKLRRMSAKFKQQKKAHYNANKEKYNEQKRSRYFSIKADPKANAELLKRNAISAARWARRNPHICAAAVQRRRAAKLLATPKWLTVVHLEEIKTIYKKAEDMTKTTGIRHHVDHIIPLLGDAVRGLHVPWNLQIITAHENQVKSNKILGEL